VRVCVFVRCVLCVDAEEEKQIGEIVGEIARLRDCEREIEIKIETEVETWRERQKEGR
jgi:hypothetical protein